MGDVLLTAAGEGCRVENIRLEIVEKPERVYNFQVEEFHTYHVGSSGVLVHNADYGGNEAPKTVPQQLARDGQTPAIGKMQDLNTTGNVVNGEFKVADYLPDMGNPKANWHQNNGILRSIMNEGVPIKDVSMFPMDNAGFLGAERNLLQSRGWIYFEGYWYPPQ